MVDGLTEVGLHGLLTAHRHLLVFSLNIKLLKGSNFLIGCHLLILTHLVLLVLLFAVNLIFLQHLLATWLFLELLNIEVLQPYSILCVKLGGLESKLVLDTIDGKVRIFILFSYLSFCRLKKLFTSAASARLQLAITLSILHVKPVAHLCSGYRR